MITRSIQLAALLSALLASTSVFGGDNGGTPYRQTVKEARAVKVHNPRRQVVELINLHYGLRIEGYIHPRGGLVVRNVYTGPASQMRGFDGRLYCMERGDVLETINGWSIDSPWDYYYALQRAGSGRVTLGVRDIRSSTVEQFSTYLAVIR